MYEYSLLARVVVATVVRSHQGVGGRRSEVGGERMAKTTYALNTVVSRQNYYRVGNQICH
jgi:predicted N-acetyltransferase YhbS